jgi:signal transduction histidine kinase
MDIWILIITTIVIVTVSGALVSRIRRDYRARLQAHLKESELELKTKIAELSEQMAQDMRGPLTALTSLSHLSHDMDKDKKELLQVAVARIRGITEGLLKTPEEHASVEENSDLLQVVESLLKEYRFSHRRAEWTFHKHVSSPKVTIAADEIKIQRILSNLLDKSLEALPETGATIDLTLMERPEHYILQIMDNGQSVPNIDLLDTRSLLESLGGELQVRDREGVGTQMILLFPKEALSNEHTAANTYLPPETAAKP